MDPRTFTSCPGSTFQYHFSPLCLLKNFTPFLIFTICFNHQRTQTPENIMPSLCCILLLVSTNCPHPYFYLSCVLCLVAQSCLTLCDPMDCNSPGSSVHGDSPGKNTAVSCHALLQGIFLTQGSNLCLLCLLCWQVASLLLELPGNPFTLSLKMRRLTCKQV